MSGLRRRFLKVETDDSPLSSPEISRENSPQPESEDFKLVPKKHYDKLAKTKGTKRRSAWVFILGGVFGILAAGFFAGSNDMIDMASLQNMNLDTLIGVLPAGLIKAARELQVRSLHIYYISLY